MRKTIRLIAVLLMMAVALGGCTNKEGEYTPEEGQKMIDEANDILRDAHPIDGFENATLEYERFNSYASENGLDGTQVFIEGKVLNQTNLDDRDSEESILTIVVEQKDGNIWCVSVISENKIDNIQDKEVRVFGMYTGFSDVHNLPSMIVGTNDMDNLSKARIEVNENGKYTDVWNFYDDYMKDEIGESENEDYGNGGGKAESEITQGQLNALKSAKNYLSMMPFSYSGLIEQLEFEQYSNEDAVYAADNCGADWNEQAVKSAKNYLDMMPFSKDELIEQLQFEGFTYEQAVYGVEQNGY